MTLPAFPAAFDPNGTIHNSPARRAGFVQMPFAVLQGRITRGARRRHPRGFEPADEPLTDEASR